MSLVTAKGAALSEDRLYRYHLWRTWGELRSRHVMFIGLNPSTADETTDDMTIKKCIEFARQWGYQGIHMLNLFGFRATFPKDLVAAESPISEPGEIDKNSNLLAYYGNRCGRVVCCWGSVSPKFRKQLQFDERIKAVLDLVHQENVWCLGRTADGSPRHPSRIAYSTPLEPYVFGG